MTLTQRNFFVVLINQRKVWLLCQVSHSFLFRKSKIFSANAVNTGIDPGIKIYKKNPCPFLKNLNNNFIWLWFKPLGKLWSILQYSGVLFVTRINLSTSTYRTYMVIGKIFIVEPYEEYRICWISITDRDQFGSEL